MAGEDDLDLNAMRDDLNTTRADLTTLTERVDAGFAQVRGVLDGQAAGQERIVALLNQIIDRDA